MFDKVGRLAERAAVALSRRSFLSRIGRIGVGALAFATFVGEAAAGQGQCIKGGACCGPGVYYLTSKRRNNVPGCYADAACTQPYTGCFASAACCGGTGYCGLVGPAGGVACYPCNTCLCNPC
jgi:hypothetical protein